MNNLTKKLFLIIAASLSFNIAFAGGTVGNGGDIVYCMPKPGDPFVGPVAEMFDIYEARTLRGWKPDLGAASLTVQEKVDLALSRFNRANLYAPGMYDWLKDYADNFWKDAVFIANTDLTEIDDSFEVALPKTCSLKQIAIQLRNPSSFEKRYIIDQDLWKSLDADNQAALVLHEIIYRIAIESGATHSVGTRLISSLLFSNTIASLNWETMMQTWKNAGFNVYSLGQSKIRLPFFLESIYGTTQLQYDSSGYIISTALPLSLISAPNDFYKTYLINLGHDELLFLTGEVATDFNIKTYINSDFNTEDIRIKYDKHGHLYLNVILEAYLGAKVSKFRLKKDSNDPEKKTSSIIEKIVIGSNKYCITSLIYPEQKAAPNPFPFPFPDVPGYPLHPAYIEVVKADGTRYTITKDTFCLDMKGDLIN